MSAAFDVSLSVTVASTCTVSSMSAKPEGWLLREPMLRKALMTGARFAPLGATKVNALASVLVLPLVVTATSAAPAVVRSPVTAVMEVLPDTTTPVAGTPPIDTVASLAKPVPLMVMLLPPVVLPLVGETDVTFGAELVGPEGLSEPHATTRNGMTATSAAPTAGRRRNRCITVRRS